MPETKRTPQWWSLGLSAAQREARWKNAATRTQTQGTHDARVRTIWDPTQQTVYFEFRVDGDPSLDAAVQVQEQIAVAAQDDDINPCSLIFIATTPPTATSNPAHQTYCHCGPSAPR